MTHIGMHAHGLLVPPLGLEYTSGLFGSALVRTSIFESVFFSGNIRLSCVSPSMSGQSDAIVFLISLHAWLYLTGM